VSDEEAAQPFAGANVGEPSWFTQRCWYWSRLGSHVAQLFSLGIVHAYVENPPDHFSRIHCGSIRLCLH